MDNYANSSEAPEDDYQDTLCPASAYGNVTTSLAFESSRDFAGSELDATPVTAEENEYTDAESFVSESRHNERQSRLETNETSLKQSHEPVEHEDLSSLSSLSLTPVQESQAPKANEPHVTRVRPSQGFFNEQTYENVGFADYSNQRLTTVPPAVGKLTTLTQLNLNDNKIRCLPSEMRALTSMQFLWLDSNKIKEFPKVCFKLNRLESLRLRCNFITDIPEEIAREMPQLKVSVIHSTRL